MDNRNVKHLVSALLVAVAVGSVPAAVWSQTRGAFTMTEASRSDDILADADARIAEANRSLSVLQGYIAELDPQSDTLAAEMRDLSISLSEVRGYVAVAEQHRGQLATALAERATRWTAAEHHYDMIVTACAQAMGRVTGVLQTSSQASRYGGERMLTASVDGRIPSRDVSQSGEVVESIETAGVDDRGVDSPVF